MFPLKEIEREDGSLQISAQAEYRVLFFSREDRHTYMDGHVDACQNDDASQDRVGELWRKWKTYRHTLPSIVDGGMQRLIHALVR